MGNAASKFAGSSKLSLPKEKPQGWTGSRVPPATTAARSQPGTPLASENKNETIDSDAMDPHFMEKLNRLGPVRVVDPHMQTSARVRVASDVQNMYRSRMRSEAEATEAASSTVQSPGGAQNRLLASSLTELLDARKSVTSGAELTTLAKRYHVDAAILERLARVVSTPSVDPGQRTTRDRHGEESLTMMAHWVDPAFSSR